MNTEEIVEKELHAKSGFGMLFTVLVLLILDVAMYIGCGFAFAAEQNILGAVLVVTASILICVWCVLLGGFKTVKPKEALVLTLFGKYHGTIKEEGYYYVNPFCSAVVPHSSHESATVASGANGAAVSTNNTSSTGRKAVSLKTMTLINMKQKVNDAQGNPIIIGANVIWRVVNPTIAVLSVEDYREFLATQCDSIIRNVSRMYPYDSINGDAEEKTLRGSSIEIAENMKKELQERVTVAGLEIMEVKITHLSYAEEIAAAMLQRQQAEAVIAAKQKIVEGAVSMVKMAIEELGEEEIVVLDEERKAAMVSNLLVVLCGNRDVQPVVNSSSIY
jgi:regulator of protease activity HflC (stomatin/prohibitin superfamily)